MGRDPFKCSASASKLCIQQAKSMCFMGVLCQLSGPLNVPIGLLPALLMFDLYFIFIGQMMDI